MNFINIALILLYGMMASIPKDFCLPKKVSKNGMTVKWEQINDEFIFEVTAPTKGWIGIGLNPKKQLVGSNLIMANLKNKKCTISDRFIESIGVHQSMEELGASSLVKLLDWEETTKGWMVKFKLNKNSADPYHFDLKKGSPIHLHMAYSQDSDFDHHSQMRTALLIHL